MWPLDLLLNTDPDARGWYEANRHILTSGAALDIEGKRPTMHNGEIVILCTQITATAKPADQQAA